MKIALGTANFERKYGALGSSFSKNNISNLNKLIKQKKINYIDTAFIYTSSNKILRKLNLKKVKIITKVELPKKNKFSFINKIEYFVKSDLKVFKKKNFDYILFGNVSDLSSKYSEALLSKIFEIKKKGLTKKIGVSIYSPNDLKLIFSKFKPHIIQAPLNIFDNRLIKSKWFKILIKKKIPIQIRSIFLQGLLLKDVEILKKKKIDKKILYHIKKFEDWINFNNLNKLNVCLQFIKKKGGIQIVTIGADNIDNIKQILKFLKNRKKIKIKNFSTTQLDVIDPRRW